MDWRWCRAFGELECSRVILDMKFLWILSRVVVASNRSLRADLHRGLET